MKHLKIACGLVVATCVMVVATGSAMALEPRFVTCEKTSAGAGRWSNSTCTTAGKGEWETRELIETVETTVSGSLEFEDSNAVGGAIAFKCEVGPALRTAGRDGTGQIISLETTKCEFTKHGECEVSKPIINKLFNLPWLTQLEERENSSKEKEVRDAITSEVAGKDPEIIFECTAFGLFTKDECAGVSSTNVLANRAEGTVATEFETISAKEPGNCTKGGKNSWFIRGSLVNKLRRNAYWVLAAALKT